MESDQLSIMSDVCIDVAFKSQGRIYFNALKLRYKYRMQLYNYLKLCKTLSGDIVIVRILFSQLQ